MRLSRRLWLSTAMSVALLVVAGLTTPPLSTAAAAGRPTCEGRRATVVGGAGHPRLRGTAGDDVILTAGSMSVDAFGGDDLICTTGTPVNSEVLVSSGAGDDIVDRRGEVRSSPHSRDAYVDLGPGVDTFYGSADYERLDVGGGDTVIGGGGGDEVVLGRGKSEGPATATIRLSGRNEHGLAPEVFFFAPPAPGFDIRGGWGHNTTGLSPVPSISFRSLPGAAWAMDTASGTVTRDGKPFGRLNGFEEYDVGADGTSFDFVGSARGEYLAVGTRAPVTVSMGGGDDRLGAFLPGCAGYGLRQADGGPGHDTLYLEAGGSCSAGAPVLDLGAGELHPAGQGRRAPLAGFDDATLVADKGGLLVGDDLDNTLEIEGCGGSVRGGDGDDHVFVHPAEADFDYAACPGTPVVTLEGEDGDDVLRTAGDLTGRMTGGAGHDIGQGGGTTSTCDTEVRMDCRRPT